MVDAGTVSYLEGVEQAEGATTEAVAVRILRQSRKRRAERYLLRLPLLDEDPHESELPHLPPGEREAPLAHLTPLGKRLVGLVEWEEDGVIRQPGTAAVGADV